MKTLFLTGILIGTISLVSSGQIEKPITKGHILTGGSLAVDIAKTKKYNQVSGTLSQIIYYTDLTTFAPDLYFGYFLFNQMALGLKANLSFSTTKSWSSVLPGESKSRYNDLYFGPFIRYYSSAGIFIEANTSIDLIKYPTFNSNWKKYAYGVGVGYSWFITKSIAIEPKIKYTHLNRPPYFDDPDIEKTDDLNMSIGFQIYLNLKKEDSSR